MWKTILNSIKIIQWKPSDNSNHVKVCECTAITIWSQTLYQASKCKRGSITVTYYNGTISALGQCPQIVLICLFFCFPRRYADMFWATVYNILQVAHLLFFIHGYESHGFLSLINVEGAQCMHSIRWTQVLVEECKHLLAPIAMLSPLHHTKITC